MAIYSWEMILNFGPSVCFYKTWEVNNITNVETAMLR
jgi:hypothetical protein